MHNCVRSDLIKWSCDSIRHINGWKNGRRQDLIRRGSAPVIEFEKQKAAEAEAAKERDRQAYRERGWPSG
jgi:hypothetical protein